jgi:Domain of unknown function (DUF5655)
MTDTYTLNDHFAGKEPIVRTLYDKLLEVLHSFGSIIEEPKKTSIHLVNKSALAGVETRKSYLLLNIKADHKLDSPRIQRAEQVSASRFHHKVKIEALDDFDMELEGWLKEAYLISG